MLCLRYLNMSQWMSPEMVEVFRQMFDEWMGSVEHSATFLSLPNCMRQVDHKYLFDFLDRYYGTGPVIHYAVTQNLMYVNVDRTLLTQDQRDMFNRLLHTCHQVHCELARRMALRDWMREEQKGSQPPPDSVAAQPPTDIDPDSPLSAVDDQEALQQADETPGVWNYPGGQEVD